MVNKMEDSFLIMKMVTKDKGYYNMGVKVGNGNHSQLEDYTLDILTTW